MTIDDQQIESGIQLSNLLANITILTDTQTKFVQIDGDFGNPYEWGGKWLEVTANPRTYTGGYMEMFGNDAGGPENRCFIRYKHISPSGHKKTREGFRTEEWCNEWINKFDVDV